nr:N-acyl homoserine lactonase family protein [Cytobacillus firmus]
MHPLPYSGWLRKKSKKHWVPVSAYLIEHPKGLILVDTGWHEDMRINQRKHLGFLPSTMYKGRLPAGQSIREQLQARGIKDTDLDYVILTHLHSDHVSGIKHVKNAKRIITSEPEWKAAQKDFGYIPSMWAGINIEALKYQEIPYGPFKLGLDLFNDGKIFLIHTPGHSKGLMSVFIKTSKGWVLLASDVGYAEKSWKENVLPGVTPEKENAQASLEWVRKVTISGDSIMTIFNHDPKISPQTIE